MANDYKNAEGYSDPTAGGAFSNIGADAQRREAKRQADISALIPIIRNTAALVGFEIAGRITLIDKETGKKYK